MRWLILLILVTAVSADKIDYKVYPYGELDPIIVNTVTKVDNLTVSDIYCYRPNLNYLYWDMYVCEPLSYFDNWLVYFGNSSVPRSHLALHVLNETNQTFLIKQNLGKAVIPEKEVTDTRIRKCWEDCDRRDNIVRRGIFPSVLL